MDHHGQLCDEGEAFSHTTRVRSPSLQNPYFELPALRNASRPTCIPVLAQLRFCLVTVLLD